MRQCSRRAPTGVRNRALIAVCWRCGSGREYILELKWIAFGQNTVTRDRLSAIKELLKLEPAGSQEVEHGSVFHVYPDKIVREQATDAPGADPGEVPAQP